MKLDLRRHGMFLAGLSIVLCMSALALLAPWIAPYDPAALNLDHILMPPSPEHILGTDAVDVQLHIRRHIQHIGQANCLQGGIQLVHIGLHRRLGCHLRAAAAQQHCQNYRKQFFHSLSPNGQFCVIKSIIPVIA